MAPLEGIKRSLLSLADFIAPRQCSLCGQRLRTGEGSICHNCLFDLQYSEYSDGRPGNGLERALWLKLPIQRAAALLTYDRQNSQRELVLDLKYHNRPQIGLHIAPLFVERLKSTQFFDGIDLIIPLPIPTRRRLHRGYNQSDQLALGISRLTQIPIDTRSVKRKNYTISQTRLTADQRFANVIDSFKLMPNNNLQGKHVLIIDDVITSTASIQGCAKALKQVPGIKISVLSLAVSRNLIQNIRLSNPQQTNNQPLPPRT